MSLLCFNFLHAQEEEEEYVTHEEYNASNIVEGGMQYFIPQSDFARKSPDAVLGGEFTYLRRIYNSGLFLGLNFSFRSLDQFTIDDFQPLLDIETKVNNNNIAVLGRFYPELYLSIFEFFAEGGVE